MPIVVVALAAAVGVLVLHHTSGTSTRRARNASTSPVATTLPVSATAPAVPTTVSATSSSTTTGTAAPAPSGGRVLHNSVVEVSLPAHWAVSSNTPTQLYLAGPGGIEAGMSSFPVPSGVTLSYLVPRLERDLEGGQRNSQVCNPPTHSTLPGGLPDGVAFGVCRIAAGRSGTGIPVEVVVAVTLRPLGGKLRAFEVSLSFRRALRAAQIQAAFGPLDTSIRWLGVSA